MCSDYARERRRQLGPHRNFAVAFVGEVEKLIDNFDAAFFAVEVGRLQNRAVPLDETVPTGDLAPAREHVIPCGAVAGQEVSRTWKRRHHVKTRRSNRARPTWCVRTPRRCRNSNVFTTKSIR